MTAATVTTRIPTADPNSELVLLSAPADGTTYTSQKFNKVSAVKMWYSGASVAADQYYFTVATNVVTLELVGTARNLWLWVYRG